MTFLLGTLSFCAETSSQCSIGGSERPADGSELRNFARVSATLRSVHLDGWRDSRKPSTLKDVAVRTDLRHVTPYDERFGVKIGPMRTIDF
jgi:hypothetical protein